MSVNRRFLFVWAGTRNRISLFQGMFEKRSARFALLWRFDDDIEYHPLFQEGQIMKTKAALFTAPKVYRPSWPNRFFPLLVGAGVVIFMWIVLFFTARQSGPPTPPALFVGTGILSLFVLLLCGLFCIGTQGVYILTAPEGLFYQSWGFCLYTPWKQVGEVTKVTYGMRDIEQLNLKREPMTEMDLKEAIREQMVVLNTAAFMRAVEEAQPALSTVATVSNLMQDRSWLAVSGRRSSTPSASIPVGIFGAQWKTGELGEEIKRYKVAELYAQMREKEQREGGQR